MTALRHWLAEGTAQRWLAGAALVAALSLLVGLVAVVVLVSAGFFWPRPILELHLRDGGVVLGEEWGRDDDPATPQGRRLRIKIGNRDIFSLDFRWVREADVVARRTPADAWLLERREYGNFYGFPQALRSPAGLVPAAEPSFPVHLASALAETRRLVRAEEALLRRASRLHEPVARLRLRVAAAERTGKDPAALRAELEAATRREQTATPPLLAELAALRGRAAAFSLLMRTADGVERELGVASVLRVVPANRMTAGEKLALYFSRWGEFVSGEPRESNTEGGIFPAIFGTALMVLLMTVVVVPLGVITAVYLNEYAGEHAFTNAVRLALANLAGVPSIVFGAFGLAFFVYTVGGGVDRLFFADTLPTPTFGTGGILWASLTLALLTVPVVVVATEEGLQSVPQAVRDGARALGATRWQTVRRVVLPYATPGILTGTILAVARAAGEVAPLMLTGVVKLAPALAVDTTPPFLHLERKFMHLGFHIYDVGFQSPNIEAAKPSVYATVLVLLVLVVVLNLTAITLRNRLRRRLRSSAV